MKNLSTFLIVLYVAFGSSFCYGQSALANENGLIVTYKVGDKIGSRFDENCKTTFDIYQVEGTVENRNTDKAAMATAILKFNGQVCNKIFSNDGPTKGEVVNKLFNLDVYAMSGQNSKYWVNRVVHLLPTEKMTGEYQVEVIQGGSVDKPELYFNYELIPGQGNGSDNKTEEIEKVSTKEEKTATGNNIYTSLIVGDWNIARVIYVDEQGNESEENDISARYIINANGTGSYSAYGEKYSIKWFISGNEINISYDGDEGIFRKIIKLDSTTLILKFGGEDTVGQRILTFKRQ